MYPINWLFLFLMPPVAERPAYVLDTAEVEHVEATLSCSIRCDTLHAREWIIFLAQAPETPGQKRVKSTLRSRGLKANELSPLHRPILIARTPASTRNRDNSISFQATYEASLFSRRLRPLEADESPPVVAKLSDKERKAALLERGHYDFSKGEFQQWLRSENLRRGRGEGDVDFALRVFQAIQGSAVYHYQPVMDRHAAAVCRDKRSDCGGLSVLFVSALRANGIPARALFGRWAHSDRPGEKVGGTDYHQTHVKSEFYAEGIGWIPVDVSQAVTNRRGEPARSFVHGRGDFLTLHVDPDLEVDTVHFGRRTVANLQAPVYWVTGQGSAESTQIEETWHVHKIP